MFTAQVRNATPTNVISQFDYTYDAAGRRVSIAKSGSAFGDLSGSVDAYTCNSRSELTSARRTKNGQPIPGFSEDFDYDPIGNRRSSAIYNEKGEAQTSTYEANNLNQYTTRTAPGYAAVRGEADPAATVTVNGNPTFRLGSYYFGSDLFDNTAAGGLANLETYATLNQTAANGDEADDLVSVETNQVYIAQSPETFAYDDDGNQTLITTKTGLWRVAYNGENRLIRWVRDSDNTTLVMAYDHMGRRRAKNTQRFVYDGYLQIANFHSQPQPPTSTSYFIWDPTEPIATRPLAWQRGTSAAYYVCDGNKNVSEVVAIDNDIAAHYECAPFGAVILQRGTSATANPFRFSSEYAEDDTATVYYNYRHYEPVTGRWMQRDPIEEEGGLGLYILVQNDLLDSVDTLGQINFNNAVSSGLCIVACYFGFTTDEIKDLFYAWASPDKLPRDVRRAFELEARKQITGSGAASSVTSAEIQMAVKKLGYKKLRDRLSTKAVAKLAKVLAPNAVPTIGQVVSAIMAVSELATVCDCFWKCGLKIFFPMN